MCIDESFKIRPEINFELKCITYVFETGLSYLTKTKTIKTIYYLK